MKKIFILAILILGVGSQIKAIDMLTKEMIEASEALKGLSEDQITAITGLSKSDEEIVIGRREKEIHGSYVKDVTEHLGIEKPEGADPYNWFKTDVLTSAKEAQGFKTQLKTAQDEVKTLKKKIEDGSGDETLKQQLKDANTLVADLKKKVTDTENEWKEKATTAQGKIVTFQIDAQMSKGLGDVTFKDEKLVSKSIREMVLNTAKTQALANIKPDFVKNDKGVEVLVYRDESGEIVRNADLTPKTIAQMVLEQPAVKDILESGQSGKGTGSKPDQGGGSGGTGETADLGEAKTQVQAERIIRKALLAKGLFPGDPNYTKTKTEMWKNGNCSQLPES